MLFPELAARVEEVRGRIAAAVERGGHGQRVEVIAVTKTHGAEAVRAAWDVGIRNVGENRVQEALEKMPAVDVPIAWHLIGHLQRNKVKFVDRFSVVHSLDSSRLADAMAEFGSTCEAPIEVLLQVNVSGEETKGGFSLEVLRREAERVRAMRGLLVRGAMTMAPFDASERTLREVFAGARAGLALLREAGHESATELSMGMSGDYEIAVEEGATLVRLGTILFGARGAAA
jgi:PLP dependent protein